MPAHLTVAVFFVRMLWSGASSLSSLKRQAATGLILEALLRNRKVDAMGWLKAFCERIPSNPILGRYLIAWMRGHFVVLD